MNESPLISICIPVYKRLEFVKRLLDSIASQSFKNYEVVITDDSPDDSVGEFISKERRIPKLRYYKNENQLGSPANWNASINKASGKWIKLMHDDDWFAGPSALEKFASAAEQSGAKFIFSGFNNIDLSRGSFHPYVLSKSDEKLLQTSPYYLLKTNFIGHPSTTLISNRLSARYDERIKWVVDIEFYIRILSDVKNFHVIKEPLVNLGIGSEQITAMAFRNPEIEIPENLYLLEKLGLPVLHNIYAYDYFWRLIRNLSIRKSEQFSKHAKKNTPVVLKKMINAQRMIPQGLLKIGVISKLMMAFSYLLKGHIKTGA